MIEPKTAGFHRWLATVFPGDRGGCHRWLASSVTQLSTWVFGFRRASRLIPIQPTHCWASRQWHPSSPSRRAGLTLIEVLISIFVLAIGLMGVASLIPLGQKRVLDGTIAHRKTHVAEAAFKSLVNRGALNPARWIAPTGTFLDAVNPVNNTRVLCSVASGSTATQIETDSAGLSSVNGVYNGCIVAFRRGKLAGQRRVIATHTAGATTTLQLISSFPLPAAPDEGDTFVIIRHEPFFLDPYLAARVGNANQVPAASATVFLKRITLTMPNDDGIYVSVMDMPAAESLCLSQDDLEFDLPRTNDDPQQVYYSEPFVDLNGNGTCDGGAEFDPSIHDTNGNGVWDAVLKRRSLQNYSWAATFVPSISSNTEYFRVSVVVFHKRVVDDGPDSQVPLKLVLTGGGLGGGSARVWEEPAGSREGIDALRPGRWLLVAPADGSDYRWYQVISASKPFLNTNLWTRNVTLSGADWTAAGTATLNAVLFPSAVGVFERLLKADTLPDSSN